MIAIGERSRISVAWVLSLISEPHFRRPEELHESEQLIFNRIFYFTLTDCAKHRG
jgi:hypothetical protein